jgi:uncharacterized protein (DUF924 family)
MGEKASLKSAEDVLHFWLGAPEDPPLAKSERWYKKDAALDREIKERFEETLLAGTRGELDAWKETPRGRLALVIMFDQFSRNMFRGTAQSFAQDGLARDIALDAIAAGDEGQLKHVARSFLYMPLMHSEDVDLQRKCVAAFTRLVDSSPPELRKFTESGLHYATLHADIIERFGRFPHRNEILKRPSTREEEAFLKQPNSSF